MLSVITLPPWCEHLRSNDTVSIQVLEPEKHCLELTPVCYVSISHAHSLLCTHNILVSRLPSLHFALVIVCFIYCDSLFSLLTCSCVVFQYSLLLFLNNVVRRCADGKVNRRFEIGCLSCFQPEVY